MEYLFLKRKKTTFTSERQKGLLFKVADRQWEEDFTCKEVEGRRVDRDIYKCILYQLEVKQAFLDAKLSLRKLSAMAETNQTYLSNVVNKYFGCNLKELLNTYRVEYAKELLRYGYYPIKTIPERCGFASRSAFYTAFGKITGMTPMQYIIRVKRGSIPTSPATLAPP